MDTEVVAGDPREAIAVALAVANPHSLGQIIAVYDARHSFEDDDTTFFSTEHELKRLGLWGGEENAKEET